MGVDEVTGDSKGLTRPGTRTAPQPAAGPRPALLGPRALGWWGVRVFWPSVHKALQTTPVVVTLGAPCPAAEAAVPVAEVEVVVVVELELYGVLLYGGGPPPTTAVSVGMGHC